jgi:hypothetical protein
LSHPEFAAEDWLMLAAMYLTAIGDRAGARSLLDLWQEIAWNAQAGELELVSRGRHECCNDD